MAYPEEPLVCVPASLELTDSLKAVSGDEPIPSRSSEHIRVILRVLRNSTIGAEALAGVPASRLRHAIVQSRVSIRFYAELNDHLPPEQRYRTLERTFYVPSTVKDIIESFGVPHAEVDLITANGESVDFSYPVRDGDRISVYPMFESLDITPELRVRPQPLRESKFVLDVHLGRLAAYLRMLGFDTVYRNCFSDDELVKISVEQRRILLTRDRGVLKHSAVTHGYWLRETDSRRQAAEIVRRFDLLRSIQPFTRCMACNGVLDPVSKDQVRDLLPPRTAELYDEFRQCPQCGRVYWKGSHYARMQRWIEQLPGC